MNFRAASSSTGLLLLATLVVPSLASFASLASLTAAEKADPGLIAIEVEQAGPDYVVQGEYLSAGKPALGVQVIANGKGTFTAVILPGGLPGAGWDGKTRQELNGQTSGSETTFSGEVGKVVISAGTLTVTGADGKAVTLKKTNRVSPTMGAKPPAGAIVLFDGSNTDAWDGSMDERKLLKYGATTKQKFGSFTIHLEFILPFKPYGRGQDRGNSGLYFQQRYECQVLDSFGLKGENNECGGIYTIAKPQVNMCFPPLSWQTYDADFTAATFADGKKTANAKLTVRHNGVVIHQDQDLPKGTGGGKDESAELGGLHLQDHGNPTFYRNIWLLERR